MRYKTEQPTMYDDIGLRIMLGRRRLRLSQRAFGAQLGLSHAAVSDIERAKTRPDLDNLAMIADALGVPLAEIVVLEARRPPAPATEEEHR